MVRRSVLTHSDATNHEALSMKFLKHTDMANQREEYLNLFAPSLYR